MSTIQIGQVLLEQYQVVEFIAAGGMGAVYKVWDLKRQVPLAMKVLHADLAEDPHILKRFRREANALKKLTHPNIVPFYGMYQTLDFVFLLEAYIDGPTLKEVLKRKGRLSVEEALVVLKGVSAALSYAHAHGVVHCDVKPGNIMLDSGGRVYLTDFGIVRHAESTTTTIAFAGTAAYMAPEQVRGEAVSPATDVYALGVVAYELLVGRRPFTGEEEGTVGTATRAERLRMAHLKLAPPDPREYNPALSEEGAQVLLKALAKDPAERYPDAWAFFQALCRAFGKEPEGIPDRQPSLVEGVKRSFAPPIEKEVRREFHHSRPVVLWGVLGLLLVLVVGGGVMWASRRASPRSVPGTDSPENGSDTEGLSTHTSPTPLPTLPKFTSTPTRRLPTFTPTSRPTPTPRPTATPIPIYGFLGDYDLVFASTRGSAEVPSLFLYSTRTDEWMALPQADNALWPSFCGDYILAEVNMGNTRRIFAFDTADMWAVPVIDGKAYGVPRCSPDGTKVAYSVKRGNKWGMVVTTAGGSLVFEDWGSRLAGYASWTRDGKEIYYMRYATQGKGFRLYYADLRDGTMYDIGPKTADGYRISSWKYPAISPDGSELAFVCWIDSRAYLCVTTPGSDTANRLVSLPGQSIGKSPMPRGAPMWSDDGRWIYFASPQSGNWDIYRIHPDGSGLEKVVGWHSHELTPALWWRP